MPQVTVYAAILFIYTLKLAACGAISSKIIYEHLLSLDNFVASDTPLVTSNLSNVTDWANLCFEDSQCLYYRLSAGTCFLYMSTSHHDGPLQGAVYFTKYADPCPISRGFLSVSSPRLCFKLSESSDTRQWSDCQSQCQSQGGRLMILNTADKQNYIAQYLNQKIGAYYSVWVGMTQVNSVFTWTDGTTNVAQWGDGEPDYLSYQNCGKIYQGGMSDVECEDLNRYLCDISLTH